MKKLITILFLFAFSLQAQIQLSEDYSFAPDKQKHAIVGIGLNAASFALIYNKTGDEALSKRGSIIFVVAISMFKEIGDHLQGGEISIADMLYTNAFSIATSVTLEQIVKHRKRKRNKNITFVDDQVWSLDNKFINK